MHTFKYINNFFSHLKTKIFTSLRIQYTCTCTVGVSTMYIIIMYIHVHVVHRHTLLLLLLLWNSFDLLILHIYALHFSTLLSTTHNINVMCTISIM